MIVYLSIGNSDNKLSQYDWARYIAQMRGQLGDLKKHGEWFSAPDSVYQNVCWCVEVPEEKHKDLQEMLRFIAGGFRQDSIAWAEVNDTQFLSPVRSL